MKVTSKNLYKVKTYTVLVNKVKKLNKKNEFSKIIKLLTNNVILKFDNIMISNLFLLRGTAYNGIKEYDKAINDYTTAIEFNPDFALAYYNIGTILVSVKRNYDEALKYFECAHKFDKKLISSRVSIASIYRFWKNYNRALDILNNTIKIDPHDANAFYNRGIVKMEGYISWEESINDFKEFKKLTPNSDTWVNYADYYIHYMTDRIRTPLLVKINKLITKIKNCLIFDKREISHYTSLYALKN